MPSKLTQLATASAAVLIMAGWAVVKGTASDKPIPETQKTTALAQPEVPAVSPPASTLKAEPAPLDTLEQASAEPEAKPPTALSDADQKFLETAGAVSLLEAEIGRLARSNSGTEEVVTLGDELTTNQTRTAAALRELAKMKNFDLKAELAADHEKVLAGFKAKMGEQFDQAFRDYVANDRSNSLRVFSAGARTVKDLDIRLFAEQTLGELKEQRPVAATAVFNSANKTAAAQKAAASAESKVAASKAKPKARTPSAKPAAESARPSPVLPPIAAGEPEIHVASPGYAAEADVKPTTANTRTAPSRRTATSSILDSDIKVYDAAPRTNSRSTRVRVIPAPAPEPVRRPTRVIIRRPLVDYGY